MYNREDFLWEILCGFYSKNQIIKLNNMCQIILYKGKQWMTQLLVLMMEDINNKKAD